jgi:hypothetical protein
MKPEPMIRSSQDTHCRAIVLRSIRLIVLLSLALGLSACSTEQMIEALLDDPPPRPGAERTHGDIHLYNRDKYGDWTVERKYGEEQTQQSEAYRDYRRRKND